VSARRHPAPTASRSLACEYFAKGRVGSSTTLPFTICRPFKLRRHWRAGGRSVTRNIPSGNIKLAMSHVVPDLVQKVLKGQDPLHILGTGEANALLHLRAATWPRGLRRRCSTRLPATKISTFSTPLSTTVLELAEVIWAEGPRRPESRSASCPEPAMGVRRANARSRHLQSAPSARFRGDDGTGTPCSMR